MPDDPTAADTDDPRARLAHDRLIWPRLHDVIVDDLRAVWATEHPDGAEPWDAP